MGHGREHAEHANEIKIRKHRVLSVDDRGYERPDPSVPRGTPRLSMCSTLGIAECVLRWRVESAQAAWRHAEARRCGAPYLIWNHCPLRPFWRVRPAWPRIFQLVVFLGGAHRPHYSLLGFLLWEKSIHSWFLRSSHIFVRFDAIVDAAEDAPTVWHRAQGAYFLKVHSGGWARTSDTFVWFLTQYSLHLPARQACTLLRLCQSKA